MIHTVKHRLRLIPKGGNGLPTYNPSNGMRFLNYKKPLDLLKGYIDPNSWLDLNPALKDALGITDGMSEDLIKDKINKNNDGLTLKTATWANTMQYVGAAADLISNALPERDEYEGRYGSLSQGIDLGWSAASDVVSLLGPAGMVVGGFMKGASALNKGLNALGLSTDGLSKTDAVLSSDLLGWTPIGILNSAGAKLSDTITKDTLAFAQAGNSYTGTSARVDDAESREGKYGLFSHNALNRANKIIGEAKEQLSKVLDITNNARRRSQIQGTMSLSNSVARNMRIHGGYNLTLTRAGEHGMRILNIVRMANGEKVPSLSISNGGLGYNTYTIVEPVVIKKGTISKNPYSNKLYNSLFGLNGDYKSSTGSTYDYEPLTGSIYDYDRQKEYYQAWLNGDLVFDTANLRIVWNNQRFASDNNESLDNAALVLVKTKQSGGTIDKTKCDPNGNYSEEEEDLSWIKHVPMIDVEGYNDMTYEQLINALIDAVKALKIPPRFIQRLNEYPRGIWHIINGMPVKGSHELDYKEYDGMGIVYPLIQEIDGKLQFIPDRDEACRIALANGNYLKFATPDQADLFSSDNYKKGWPEYMDLFFNKPIMENSIDDVMQLYHFDIRPDILQYLGIDDASLIHVLPAEEAYTDGDNVYIDFGGDIEEQLIHELTHWLYGHEKANADQYKSYWLDLDDKKLADLGADLRFVKRTGDPGVFYNPDELLARINAARWMAGRLGEENAWAPTFFGLVRGNDENMYGDNFRDLLHMYNDNTLSEIFKLVPVVSFQHGGKTNVIPDGALHKERHGMEKMDGLEDVTRKGIPVVSLEEGGEIVQQAEIERSELILRLEVTEKIELLYKIYYDENSSAEEKDAAAIEAGKILAVEIIHNTNDLTNNII